MSGRKSTNVVSYDNLPATPTIEHPEMVEFERIYCIDESSFDGWEWNAIGNIYRGLPGALRFDAHNCPMWFGIKEDTPPFLWASAEPPGIQVAGVLPLADWLAWDNAFSQALEAAGIPFRDLS